MKSARRFPTIEHLEDRIAPASFMVTNLNGDNSPGSLTKAVNESNDSDGPDTITFKAGLTGTIFLNGALGFDEGITIKGPGSAKLTIDGGGTNVFLFSNVATDDPITVSGLTLKNGAASGTGRVIYSTEPTTLIDVKLIGNPNGNFDLANGGALFVNTSGNITIKNCEFTGNIGAGSGGGAYLTTSGTGAKVAISGSIFSDNDSSGAGGGLFADLAGTGASLTVDHTTFTGNTAMQAGVGKGGALQIQAGGGGLAVIKNSTFTGNLSGDNVDSGGGAIFQTGGTLFVQGSLFSANSASHGGAIAATGVADVSVQKSQFHLNRAPYNAVGEGGGAIHLTNVPIWTVAGSGFIANKTVLVGGAIFASGGAGEITKSTFRGNSSSSSGGAVNVFESDLKISGSLFSANQGTEGGALYAAKNANPATLLVTGSRFTGNIATSDGGAVRLFGVAMTVKNSTFDHNLSAVDGGAIFANGSLDSEGSFYRDNVADGAGGGIYGTSIFKLKGGAVTNNRAGGNGGGLSFTGAEPEITKVLIANNTSGGNGAGLYFARPFPGVTSMGKMLQCKIVGNTVTSGASGGGIYMTNDVTFTLMKNVITDNISGDGGGIFSAGTAIDIDNKIFGNFAPTHPDTFGL